MQAIHSGQGDLMSPHLFNMITDWVIEELDPSIGALLGDGRTNVCAFADDLVLIAATPIGLRPCCSNGKSATLRIDINSKPKCWVVNPNPFLRVTRLPGDAALIPSTLLTQAQKYLGVEISAGAIKEKAATQVQ